MELKFILESILFSAQKPMTWRELRDLLVAAAAEENSDPAAKPFKKTKEEDISAALEQLAPITRPPRGATGWCASPGRGNSPASRNTRRG